jgi:hypothetical protein
MLYQVTLISHGTAVNNTFRQVASSIGTAILISVLSNVTKGNLPSDSMLNATPLAYKEKAVEATLSGYHAAFYVAVVFGFLGFLIAFSLKKKEPQLTVINGGADK